MPGLDQAAAKRQHRSSAAGDQSQRRAGIVATQFSANGRLWCVRRLATSGGSITPIMDDLPRRRVDSAAVPISHEHWLRGPIVVSDGGLALAAAEVLGDEGVHVHTAIVDAGTDANVGRSAAVGAFPIERAQ